MLHGFASHLQGVGDIPQVQLGASALQMSQQSLGSLAQLVHRLRRQQNRRAARLR
ncbi:hypothetical protein D3C76_1843520 [compost metagenome]